MGEWGRRDNAEVTERQWMELQELLNQYIKKFEEYASNTHYDNVVRRVFNENKHNGDIEAVLLKVSVLNSLYRTNIFDVYKMAKHIVGLARNHNLDDLLNSGDLKAVELIRHGHGIKRKKNNKELDLYSFATKYCHWSNPESYPIYDTNVYKALMSLKRKKLINNFKSNDLWNIEKFKKIIDIIMEKSGITSYKKIDQVLWGYGKSLQ